jgi:hypothetical protein
MPSLYREMELGLRNQIALQLERGKVDFSIFIESTAEQTSTKVNVPIVKAYMEQLRAVYAEADEVELMKMAIRMPDTMKTEREEIDENDWAQIETAIAEALQNILTFRFSNTMFEPLWNNKHIKKVEINLFEKNVPGVTVVVAPAGYGKTSLMSEWASQSKKKVAWYTMSENDKLGEVSIYLLSAIIIYVTLRLTLSLISKFVSLPLTQSYSTISCLRSFLSQRRSLREQNAILLVIWDSPSIKFSWREHSLQGRWRMALSIRLRLLITLQTTCSSKI